MTRRVIRIATASRDLDRHVDYLDENAGREVGDRYASAAGAAFERLRDMPGIGSLYENANPDLQGLRQWSIPKFEKYCLFYLQIDNVVRIVRILHTSQDVDGILFLEEIE